MPLVTTEQMFKDADKGGYAIAAFNVENMEMVQAVVEAAEELKSPVILQTSAKTVQYANFAIFHALVKAAADGAGVPIALHLDHGNSFELAMQALRAGYTSIMIDGSHEAFEDNIELSRKVVEACAPSRIPVEAELGKVGGKEDDIDGGDGGLTEPSEAKEFVARTKVTSLAVAIGTSHGVYKGVPKLDLERLSEIREAVNLPLVLHGGSGLSEQSIQECIKRGIRKVNYATELRIAFTEGVKQALSETPDIIDPKKFTAAGRDKVKQMAMDKLKICGSVGKVN
ncbi:D-tagatose-1,6-bisphosphate aldolase subunit KbaY [Chlamydia abortus]|uniref:Class II fructose-1,6-bisphosphate aldolase n=1 Tax=Paenibacillus residui TaxID=629724 RepID=A0ABW3DFH9_9BACL|nr:MULTISPECIES: class II fructose-1,6-bisphosphate aldolase [Paenibacillaceae]SHE13312.1 D-tagatose-1,6-bisphosphate aldolase subunit KbaY [Chlamydia abortus]